MGHRLARHRLSRCLLALAVGALALGAVTGAAAKGPQLGTTHILNTNDVRYVTTPAGASTTLEVRSSEGDVLRKASFPGAWGIPLVTLNGDVDGLSRNGRVLVLSDTKNAGTPLRARSRFLVLDPHKLAVTRTVELRGDLGFDALSPNGRMLYLIEHHRPSDVSQYRVRAYDLKSGRLLSRIVVDKREPGEVMAGFPVARASTGDGRRVFTLYLSHEHPFVHLLDTVSLAAFCIDLPSRTSQQAIERASMRLTNGGRSLMILDSDLDRLHVVDTTTLRVT
jgi:hypothetical protein